MLGVALVPVFASFGSIYAAHGAFTAAVTPPLVIALLLGIFWKRFTPTAAVWTMVGGGLAIFATILFPRASHALCARRPDEGCRRRPVRR